MTTGESDNPDSDWQAARDEGARRLENGFTGDNLCVHNLPPARNVESSQSRCQHRDNDRAHGSNCNLLKKRWPIHRLLRTQLTDLS